MVGVLISGDILRYVQIIFYIVNTTGDPHLRRMVYSDLPQDGVNGSAVLMGPAHLNLR